MTRYAKVTTRTHHGLAPSRLTKQLSAGALTRPASQFHAIRMAYDPAGGLRVGRSSHHGSGDTVVMSPSGRQMGRRIPRARHTPSMQLAHDRACVVDGVGQAPRDGRGHDRDIHRRGRTHQACRRAVGAA